MKLNFWDEGHLHADCLFYILTNSCKCLLFQFLRCDTLIQISTLAGGSKRTYYRLTNSPNLLKKVLKLTSQYESHLHSNFLLYFLTTYHKCPRFQLLGCGIHVYFPIIPVVKNGGLISWKIGDALIKNIEA